MAKILITGATGTVGGQVARDLLGRGAEVSVGVRDPDKAGRLAEAGAELVRLDLERADTLKGGLAGIERLFLVGPMSEEMGRRVPEVLAAAKSAGVTFVLRLSALGAAEDAPLVLPRQHGIADRAVAESELAWTILRPTFFQDNLITFQGAAVREKSAFYGASGDGETSYISSADIARVAAEILVAPQPHHGQTYVLTGGEAVTDHEVAALASEVTGRKIAYVNLPPEQVAAGLRAQGMPEWIVEGLVALERVKRDGYAAEVSPAVERITGRRPETYRAFLQRNRDKLS